MTALVKAGGGNSDIWRRGPLFCVTLERGAFVFTTPLRCSLSASSLFFSVLSLRHSSPPLCDGGEQEFKVETPLPSPPPFSVLEAQIFLSAGFIKLR